MQSYLDFEKPVADLEGKIADLKSLSSTDQAVSIDEEVNRLSTRADEALTDIYRKLTPWQKTQVARHPQPAAFLRLREAHHHRVDAARRRPQVLRGRGDPGRFRPLRRPVGRDHRPGEGLDHRDPPQAQFRHGQARGLPQGGAHHGHGRPLQHPGRLLRRYRRRLSRHRRRGARAGRGHRALDRKEPRARRAQPRDHHRRGRLGRRHRHRHRQPRADARARDLHRGLAGSLAPRSSGATRPRPRTPPTA